MWVNVVRKKKFSKKIKKIKKNLEAKSCEVHKRKISAYMTVLFSFPAVSKANREFKILGSLRYGDYGLRTTAGRALSFVCSTGLSRANIER